MCLDFVICFMSNFIFFSADDGGKVHYLVFHIDEKESSLCFLKIDRFFLYN